MWTLLAIKSLDQLGDKLSADTRKGLASERDKGLAFLKAAKPDKRIDWLALRVLVAKEYETAELANQLKLRRTSPKPREDTADGGSWGYVRGGERLYAHTTGRVPVLPGQKWASARAIRPCARLGSTSSIRNKQPGGGGPAPARHSAPSRNLFATRASTGAPPGQLSDCSTRSRPGSPLHRRGHEIYEVDVE